MSDIQGHEKSCRPQNDQTDNKRFSRRSSDVADHDFNKGNRRGQDFVDGTGELGKENSEGCVGDTLREYRQHHQARHDKGSVRHALDGLYTRANCGAEHHKVQRGGYHR